MEFQIRVMKVMVAFAIIILVSGCVMEPNTTTAMPMKTPSLSVYGELVDYAQSESVTTFKIQSEFIDFEANNTYLEIEATPVETYDLTGYCSRWNSRGLSRTVEECRSSLYDEYNLTQKCLQITETTENGLVYLKCSMRFDLIKGNSYAFYFTKIKSGPWTGVEVSDSLTVYKERGNYYR
jgi:hypothetical protein